MIGLSLHDGTGGFASVFDRFDVTSGKSLLVDDDLDPLRRKLDGFGFGG